MSKGCLRVVFDTNVFTRDNFALIEKATLIELCKRGRIVPVYGHVLLEETFRAYGTVKKRDELINSWLPFIAQTADRFCEDFLTIWHRELVQSRGLRTNIYMDSKSQDCLLRQLNSIPSDGSWKAWHSSKEHRDVESKKREDQHEISVGIRDEVASILKKYPQKSEAKFHPFIGSQIDATGRIFIYKLINCSNPTEIANRWSRKKEDYPFFTTFVKNILYICHYAMTNHNGKIDRNAQADLDLMTHLLHSDILVSNETGFLRKAFDDIWRPKGKVIFTSEEFTNFCACF
jgi:hypothetical protein